MKPGQMVCYMNNIGDCSCKMLEWGLLEKYLADKETNHLSEVDQVS